LDPATGARHEIIVTTQRLGRAMNHQVRAQWQWLLMKGVAKVLSTIKRAPTLSAARRDCRYINDLAQRIGRSLQKNHGRVGFDVLLRNGCCHRR